VSVGAPTGGGVGGGLGAGSGGARAGRAPPCRGPLIKEIGK
jgi:hypothetical protein